MIHISSKDNKIYKLIQKLETKKYRDKLSLYLIEGENLIVEAIKNNCRVEYVVFNEEDDRWRGFVKKEGLERISYSMDKNLFLNISKTEHSQGIVAVVKKQEPDLDTIEYFIGEGNILVLDRLQDPGNIGTLIRTADGAGYKMVVIIKGTVDPFSPKVVRSAAGSLFRVPILLLKDYKELLELTDRFKKKLVATCFENAVYYYEADLKNNIALVIGNEGNGVDGKLIDMADIRVKIPMTGNIESLNAAVSGAILMYEAMRK